MNGPGMPLARQARSIAEWVPPIALAEPTMRDQLVEAGAVPGDALATARMYSMRLWP